MTRQIQTPVRTCREEIVGAACYNSYMRSIEQAFEGTTYGRTSPMATLRLTRRGRLVLVFTVMMLAVIAGLTLGHGSSLAASHSHPVRHTLIVAPGESLWAVAARIAPHADPRAVVADIEALNHLAGPAVQPGQQLLVPTTG